MSYSFRWGGDPEDVYIETSGQATLEGLAAMTEEGLTDGRFRRDMKILTDHRALDWTTMNSADLRARAASFKVHMERLGDAHIAVVMARPVDYGMQRMMQAYLDDGRAVVDIDLFYTVEDARDWLSQFRPLAE